MSPRSSCLCEHNPLHLEKSKQKQNFLFRISPEPGCSPSHLFAQNNELLFSLQGLSIQNLPGWGNNTWTRKKMKPSFATSINSFLTYSSTKQQIVITMTKLTERALAFSDFELLKRQKLKSYMIYSAEVVWGVHLFWLPVLAIKMNKNKRLGPPVNLFFHFTGNGFRRGGKHICSLHSPLWFLLNEPCNWIFSHFSPLATSLSYFACHSKINLRRRNH